jgi:D-threo-aldose 1-dehydrogenase
VEAHAAAGAVRQVGGTGVHVTRIGLGSAEIGGLYSRVTDEQSRLLVDHAWDAGVRYFDTAPLYGYGTAERRIGAALRDRPRDSFTLSTKVGRLVLPAGEVPPGADIDRQIRDGVEDGYYADISDRRVVFDYSRGGVMRSVEASLGRLGLSRIDILFIHDPDEHWQAAIDGAYPALHELRAQGVVGAIGAGMNQAAMLARFAREGDFDVFMLAGRYTLLDQSGLAELLPLCLEKGISVVAVGVMNSGILADPRPGARYDYRTAAPALVERAARIGEVCARHGVPLRAAAIRFPLGHPAVASVAAGVRTTAHFDDYPRALATIIPAALWDELRAEGLIDPAAPTPAEDARA